MTLEELFDEAAMRDRSDPLREYRFRFDTPKHSNKDQVYLCGNSLGLHPKKAVEYVLREMDMWRNFAVEGHFKSPRPWVSFHELFTDHLAKIVGAQANEVVAMNTLTVNLHLMLASFFRPNEHKFKVLTGHAAFPSDRYAIVSQIQYHGFDIDDALIVANPRPGERTLRTEDIVSLIGENKDELCLILFDAVNYYTGEFIDIPTITAAAHKHNIIVGFDLAHAAGNVQLRLHDWGVDFAVWCSYKYLNGGPGCPAGCFIHEVHSQNPALHRFAGWWGHDKKTRFQMGPEFRAIPGAEGWQLSNPPLFSLAALLASMELFSEVGMSQLREKSEALTGLLETGLRGLFAENIEILTPADPARRGCQISVRVKSNGKAAHTALQTNGVLCDWREPDVIRLAPVPFYNRFSDVVRCLEVLATCVK